MIGTAGKECNWKDRSVISSQSNVCMYHCSSKRLKVLYWRSYSYDL